MRLAKRGLEIAPATEQFELSFLEGELLGLAGSSQASIDAFCRAAQATDDNSERCRALMGQADELVITEDNDALTKVLNQAETIALANTLNPELSRIYNIRGARYFNLRQADACLDANRKSLAYARKTNVPKIEAKSLSGLADAEYTRGRLKSAYRNYDQCIKLARQNGFARTISANLSMRASMSYWDNRIDQMRADLYEARELADKTHHVRAQMVAFLCGRQIAETGQIEEGEVWLQRGLALTNDLGWNNARDLCITSLARVVIMKGDFLKARNLVQGAVDSLRQSGSGKHFITASLGVLALTLEDPEQARSALKEAETYLNMGSFGYSYHFFEDAMALCLKLGAWDEVERYATLMENYTLEEPVARGVFFVAHGRALAAYGRGARDQGTVAELKRLHDEAVHVGLTVAVTALETALESV